MFEGVLRMIHRPCAHTLESSPIDLAACNRSCSLQHAFLFVGKVPLASFCDSPSPGEVHP